MQKKPKFVVSAKFPEEKLWKIKVTGLTTWEHTFFPVVDRCTWIDQICEIWGYSFEEEKTYSSRLTELPLTVRY